MYEACFLSAIEALLYEHDRVVLPNFGSFLAHYQPAQIHFLAATMSPPCRRVSFEPQLISNDELLINYLAAQNNWTFSHAEQEVAAWVSQLNQTLAATQTLTLDKLGRLYFDADSKVDFEPIATNFSRSSYGLPMIEKMKVFSPIISPAADATAAKNYRPLIARPEAAAALPLATNSRKGFNPKMAGLLGVLLLLIGLPLLIWLLVPRKTVENNNPTALDTIFHLPPYFGITTITEPATTDTLAANLEPTGVDTIATVISPPAENADKNTNTYIIVIGAFLEPPNANRVLRRLEKEGYFPDVATTNSGLQRIGIQITCAPAELKLHINEIRKKFTPEAWLLKS